ncbi:hypothetical protein LX36DRAFT_654282 [Colletotrichum falcatum]|nr:hypothetical protein LX36DRAFT_654282 [Colletotrichum falcatum]
MAVLLENAPSCAGRAGVPFVHISVTVMDYPHHLVVRTSFLGDHGNGSNRNNTSIERGKRAAAEAKKHEERPKMKVKEDEEDRDNKDKELRLRLQPQPQPQLLKPRRWQCESGVKACGPLAA